MRRGKPAEERSGLEFVLRICSGGSTAHTRHPSLDALDAAFWEAVRANPLPEHPVDRADGQITAETYGKIAGQGIGKTHAYRLADGRVFQRPLDRWHEAEMEPVAADDPRLSDDDAAFRP